jgi:hypothetical protein
MKRLLLILLLLPALCSAQRLVYSYNLADSTGLNVFRMPVQFKQVQLPTVPYAGSAYGNGGSVYIDTTAGTLYYYSAGSWHGLAGGGGGSGTVTSVGYTAGRGITITGTNPITGVGTWRFDADTTIMQKSISLTTTGTSGAATLVGATLNIPQYAGATYTAGNRLGLSSGAFYLDTAGLFALNFTSPNNFTLPTTAAVNSELGNYLLKADTAGLSNRINTKQNFSDTSQWDATRSWVNGQIPSLTGYVPYAGAIADLNLGANNLITSLVKTDTVQANSSMGVHIHGTGGKGIMIGAGGGGTITFDDYPITVPGDSVYTGNGSGGLLRYDLKGKLATYQLYSDTTTFDATRAWVNGRGFGTGTVTSVGVVAGTGVSIGGTSPIVGAGTYTITNTAPDQTVTITASTNITVTGSYPTFTISATGGSGGGSPLKGIAPVTITAGTGDTLVISISPNTTYQITEATAFTYSGANGLIQKITMNNALDTVTVDTATLVEGVTYELRVIQGAGGNKILHWGQSFILFQGGTTATGRPYQDIGAAEISRYFIQKSDANLYVNPVINNRN